ncbi:hypothetical protein [Kluyvera cryocrescens]|uniref:Uncharacterized protein n=1 Tax=Kluyvera cryocrescens TaxID=580 RepID=A0A485AMH4_KLUCR|nr:hypothetical protein [Kluyvera cryocrescens]VFS57589.1 Uncharacterised protein [Kluyvera cryocrescens]
MTTTQLVDRYLKRIQQIAKETERGKNLHIAGEEISSAIRGATEAFCFVGDCHPSEGFSELLNMLQTEHHSKHTPYGHVIDIAIRKVELQISIWK